MGAYSTEPKRTKPRLLDVFCCAGGASAGYVKAGFEVVGLDLAAQPNYPFEFHQDDAIEALRHLIEGSRIGRYYLDDFDSIHASPPCQFYSAMSACRPGLTAEYDELITPTRDLLITSGLPYVIENVERAKAYMRDPVTLCGFTFGRELYRHRLFETNWTLPQPEHPAHTIPASKAGHWRPGTVMSVAGHVAPVAKAREVMEIDWTTRDELAEAIPPYYTEFVGQHLAGVVQRRVAA